MPPELTIRPRELAWEGCLNVRDLGGLRTEDGRRTRSGRVVRSDNVRFWHERQTLQVPEQAWELIQLGNCGSPIETEAGWLVITHGVGPLRKYCLGALLLDR